MKHQQDGVGRVLNLATHDNGYVISHLSHLGVSITMYTAIRVTGLVEPIPGVSTLDTAWTQTHNFNKISSSEHTQCYLS